MTQSNGRSSDPAGITGRSNKASELDMLAGYAMTQDVRSLAAAERMSTVVGERAPVIDRYLEAFSKIPTAHLRVLEHRGARIVFAPTIARGMSSALANKRRAKLLDDAELARLGTERSQASGTIAVYDPSLDLIVIPTTYASRDFDHVVRHEIGHALTMPHVEPRASLVADLSDAMRVAIQAGIPADADEHQALRHEVTEALAEGYALWLAGATAKVPRVLHQEIRLMIGTVLDADRMRFRFEQGS